MTTEKTLNPAALTRLPDPPPKEPDEVTAFLHFYNRGSNEHLAVHLGNRDTTLITGDCRVMHSVEDANEARRPDVLIALGVNLEAFTARGHYVISEQGKPPDFVLEIASQSTGDVDTGPKRAEYAALGIPEYWRFDHTGEYHRTRLAGDRLAGDRYQPIAINALPDGRLRGHSMVLDLILEWREGDLNWIDPATGQHVATMEQEREARLAEREARLAAEARVRELEQRLAGKEGQDAEDTAQ